MIDILVILAMLCTAIYLGYKEDYRGGQYIILIMMLTIISYKLGYIIERLDIIIELLKGATK